MLRYLVIQSYELENDDGDVDHAEEPVIDFDSYEEAEEWINKQPDPSIFLIKDQLEEDFASEYTEFSEEDHDFDFYDMNDVGDMTDEI